MVSQGSNCDEDGIAIFMHGTPSSEEVERGFSSPELNVGEGYGVYVNSSEVVHPYTSTCSVDIIGNWPRERSRVEIVAASKTPRERLEVESVDMPKIGKTPREIVLCPMVGKVPHEKRDIPSECSPGRSTLPMLLSI